MPGKFSNNASSSLVGSISTGDTTVNLQPGDGSKFPLLAAGDWFIGTLMKLVSGLPIVEIVKVTARAGDVLTVVRAQEGTVAQEFGAGAKFELRITAGTLSTFAQTDSPTFTGTPKVPTAAASTRTDQAASTAFAGAVADAVGAAILGGAPDTLNTIAKLAAAIANDPNFATTLATALANRVRVDTAAQGLTAAQKANAVANIGALPTTGGTMSGGLTLNNSVSMFLKDTGGTPRQSLYMDSGNNVNLINAGGSLTRILSQSGGAELWVIDNVGNSIQNGAHTYRAQAPNGFGRALTHFQQQNGIVRWRFAISDTEAQEMWTYDTAGNWTGKISFANGGVKADGTISGAVVTQTSDERTKQDWAALTDEQLDALADMKLAGTFAWKDGSGRSVGGSAQEIQAIVPEAVHADKEGNLTVNYGGLTFAIQQAMLRRMRAAA